MELEEAQRQAVRWATLVTAPLLMAFGIADRFLSPAWRALLVVRVVAAAGLLGVRWLARSTRAPPLFLASLVVGAFAVVIDLASFSSGGARSPYLTSLMMVLAGISALLPLRPAEAAVLHVEALALGLAPHVRLLASADRVIFWSRALYLVGLSVIGVAGSAIMDRLRRRVHAARDEVGRQLGLANLGALAAGLAHELSQPLAYVAAELDLLHDAPLPAPAAEGLRAAEAGVSRMRAIFESMRNGARFDDGERRDVELAGELDAALALARRELSSATVARDYAPLPLVSCQPTLVGQVIVNLLVNAAHAVGERPDARVTVRARRDGARALVEVEDNGAGVPLEVRARIFEPFFTTKGAGGSGIGLWICAEIARSHGGELTVHESPGGGALFRLALPLHAPPRAPRAPDEDAA